MNVHLTPSRLFAFALVTLSLPVVAGPTASALKADSNINLAVTSNSRVLIFDADGDEDPDIWVGGTREGNDVLLTQTSDRRWMRHTVASNVGRPLAAVAFDANNDAARDLAVARRDGVHLFLNDAAGQLRESQTLRGCKGQIRTLLAGDLDGDGHIDLLALTDDAPCVWMNADGHFGDGRVPAGLADLKGALAGALLDADNDGHLDLVVNSNTEALLYSNDGRGHFRRARTLAEGAFSVLSVADYNNNGRADLFLAGDSAAPRLLLNNGNGRFREEAVAWDHGVIHTAIPVDLTNHDRLSLLIASDSGSWLLEPRTGKSAPFRDGDGARVLAVADLDRDGHLDWIERDDDGTLVAHRNRAPGGHWLSVELRGHENRAVSGARIVVTLKDGTILTRTERNGEIHHFGIGRRTEIDEVQVFWPSGHLSQMATPPIDRHLGFLEPTDPEAVVQRAKPILSVSTEPGPGRTIYCK